mmetsp:Transcript_26200/g.56844  ORF Transcript_26200/g.56844 Transcript_26200/m.56844 type:complete len:178 (+) Transcript_26200:153-686(+)
MNHVEPDYYKVLGVSPQASPETIKAAYRKLALVHHPDRNLSCSANAQEATIRFKEINAAFSVLGEPNTRLEYDALRAHRFAVVKHHNAHPKPQRYRPHAYEDYHPAGRWMKHSDLGTYATDKFVRRSGPLLWVVFMGLLCVKVTSSILDEEKHVEHAAEKTRYPIQYPHQIRKNTER